MTPALARKSFGLVFFSLAIVACLAESPMLTARKIFAQQWLLGFEQNRIINEFNSLDLNLLESDLNKRLPRTTDYSLGSRFRDNDFLRQRITEALFPRRMALGAPALLDTRGDTLLGEFPNGDHIFLSVAAPTPPSIFNELPSVQEAALLLQAFQGTVLWLLAISLGFFFGRSAGVHDVASAVLAASFLVALTYSAATILQLALPSCMLPLGGLIAMVFFLYPRPRWAWPRGQLLPEAYVGLALLVAFGCFLLIFPMKSWDGRSIWLFRAKQLYFSGMLSRQDTLSPSAQWAHYDYPLLLPSWQSFFNSLTPFSFSERLAEIGQWIFFSSLASLLWKNARKCYGRGLGTLAAAALVVGVSPLTVFGLADGLLLLLMAIAYLEFRQGGDALAWLALWSAALLKWEGLVFAVLLSVIVGGRSKRAWGLAPALIYFGWSHLFLHLPHDFSQIDLSAVIANFLPRLQMILTAVVHNLFTLYLPASGFLAFVFSILFRKGRLGSAAIVATLLFCFLCAVFMLTPLDLGWHLSTALARELIYPAGFALLALADATASL